MIGLALLLQAAAPAPAPPPSAEAVEWGTRLARSGTFSRIGPMVAEQQTGDVIKAHPELTPAEQAELRSLSRTTLTSGMDRIAAAMGAGYARAMPLADIKAVVAFQESAAGRSYRAAEPQAVAAAMSGMGQMDFRGDMLKAFCAKTGKLCAAK